MIKMCKNCNDEKADWHFKLFHYNYGMLDEFDVCDECLMETIDKLNNCKALYVFDRITKEKSKRLI